MIKTATNEETAFIMEHSTKSLNEGTGNRFDIPDEKAQKLLRKLLDKSGYFLIYKEDDQIIGWILLGKNMDYFTDEEHGFIYELYVFEEYRGKGIGKQLMIAGIEEFKNSGLKSVRLNVFASNPARKIYEQLGFEDLQTVMEYYL